MGDGYMDMAPAGEAYGTSWVGYGERIRPGGWGGAGPGIHMGCPYAGVPPLTTMGLGTGLGCEYIIGLGACAWAWLIIGEYGYAERTLGWPTGGGENENSGLRGTEPLVVAGVDAEVEVDL